MGNTEISRVLAKMWKEASQDVRKLHIEEEFERRKAYKEALAKWKEENEGGEEETADEIQDELGGVTPEQSHSGAICRSRG